MSKPEIATLVKLQEAETQIVRLKDLLHEVEKKKIKLASRLKQFAAALKENTEELEKLEKNCIDSENEIKIVDARIIKSNETLRNVTTNKEYQVLLREVDDNKKRKDALETELLQIMEEREKSQAVVNESTKEYQQLEEQIKAEQNQIEEQTTKDRKLLEEYIKSQKEIGVSLDPKLLDRFKRISKMNQGSAVANVQDEVCLGCFMNIPPQLYIEVQRGNQLILCPQCSRILYYDKS
ncbi:C4-type zinc ribbon domain-containing protein [Desulfobacter sp.]|jgi:predicted  nucleic acid-binding Zn-ribbon protein|uniref:zinc ribbon domain-containing protein n=1 Tax=Desulfobacter sp. TaxID=2294 RepID=UPI000E7DBAEB|nr:C4-type zinc ribbon domain-containing protein [Desulfobacter sp.]MBP8828694.1 nucleotide-binding protein [Desulfobacter sp.]HBT90194.1 nucleotide-binding protein [Desulfobacter sp.]